MAGLRIAFMGTPDFSINALSALHKAGHEIVCVYSQPPRPKGRGHKLQSSPVHELAESLGIEVRNPTSLKSAKEKEAFAALNLDVAIVAAYGLILPKEILDAPKHGCLNIHASNLPRWRGASPIHHAIWHGDEHSGVTIMQMDASLDTGPMIELQSIEIAKDMTSVALHDELSVMGADMIVDVLTRLILGGELYSMPQDNEHSTYAPMLKKEDGRVDWNQNAKEIDAQIRGLNPWPGVWSEIEGARLKIITAKLTNETSDQPIGTILNKKGHIVCGGGSVLKLTSVQPAGKKAMDFPSALNGGYIALMQVLL